jgi:hypothetical protein
MADQIGINFSQKTPLTAMCEGCLSGMNYFMAIALHYYNSWKLDLTTTRLYKKHKNSDLGLYK